MKTTLLIFSLMINSSFPAVFASENTKVTLSTSQDVFISKWNFTPLITKTNGDSKIHTKMFKRLLWIDKTPVPVIDTNFVYLENPVKDADPKKNELSYIAQSVKRSFGKDMAITGSGNHMTVEGKFEKINRYIKVSLLKKGNAVTIITTFARLGLYTKLKGEVEELHATLEKFDGKFPKEKKTTWYNFFPAIEEAHAGDGFNLLNILTGSNTNTSSSSGSGINFNFNGLTDVQNSVDQLSTNVDSLNTNVQNTNTNWNNTNGQIGNANTNWNNTNGQIGNANNNWNNTNTQIGNANNNWGNTNVQIGNANNNWNNTNDQLQQFNNNVDKVNNNATDANRNWSRTNDELAKANVTAKEASDNMNTNWAESNKLLAQVTDPNHMAKVAFYSAAGAALGSVAVNLAVQGVSEGISFLYELFTGAKQKKLEWSDFEKAMQAWDNQLNDLVKMEQVVDNYLAAFDFFEGKNIGNDYVKQLSNSMRDMKFDRDMFLEKFKDPNLDVACRRLYYNAADELDQKVKEYDKILQFASTNNVAANGGANYFCNQLKELQRKILGAETQMQDLRLKILVAENQYYGKQSDALDKRDEDIGRVNNRLSQTLEEKKAYDKKVTDRVKVTQKQTKKDWLSSCVAGTSDEGKMIKEELTKTFALFAYFKKKSRCNESFAKVETQLKQRDEDGIKRMIAEEGMRQGLVVRANNSVELKLSEEQMSWMARVHMDAYCYQYAHNDDQSKTPAKCKEFPELLYSMSLSKGYEKAKNAYKNKCEERYINGLQQLATAP